MKAYILYIDTPESAEYAAAASASCLQHDVMCQMVEGVTGKTYDQIKKETNMMVGRDESDHIYWKEYNAALGHIEIWKKIIASGEAGVVLEHDAVVKKNLDHIEVNDMEIVHLGPKVQTAVCYDFPGESKHYARHEVRRWEGAHAYALTPKTAQYLIDCMTRENRLMPTEALISVRNRYNLKLIAIDPAYVVCVQGGRMSFTDATSNKNFKYFPGFLAGVKNKETLYPESDYVFSEDWFSGNIPFWTEIFKFLGKKNGENLKILEIGAYEGRSTTWLVDNMMDHPESRIITCDTFEGSIEHSNEQKEGLLERFNKNMVVSKFPEKIMPFKNRSDELLPQLIARRLDFDIIYVDGSHETEDVYKDAVNSFKLLKEDGVIIFDDCRWSMDGVTAPVRDAVLKFEEEYPVVCIGDGWQRAYVKKTYYDTFKKVP